MNISRLYTGADGQTHMEWMDLESHPELATLQKAEGIQFRSSPSGHFIDWHPAPRRRVPVDEVAAGGRAELDALGLLECRQLGMRLEIHPLHVCLTVGAGIQARDIHRP